MAFGSDRSANFVIKAKDAATGPLGKVGGAMGKLKGASVTAFKAIGAAALAAGAAVLAFTADAIKGAIEDERSTILTNAALKARGFQLDQLAPKIEAQIEALQRYGKSDDDVRAGLEVGSRFFKNQNNLLKANAAAAAISSVTGRDMADVMSLIGKAANGSTRGLAALIGPIEKGATVTDIITQANSKFLAVADELADSLSGRALTAQEKFNEAMDDFGAQFLPVVSEVLTFLVEKVFPKFQEILEEVGPIISEIIDDYVGPLVDSVGELFALFDTGEESISLLDLAFAPLKATLWAIKTTIDLIVAGMKFIGIGKGSGAAQNLAAAAANAGYGGGSYINPMNAGPRTANTPTTSGYTSGYGMTPVSLTIGTKAQSELAYKYGAAARTATATRNTGRNR